MRTRRHKLQVSTFPFLAVLLCAMGALLLVLLVMDRRAHDAARARAVQAARRVVEDAASEAEARRSVIEGQRQEARAARLRERDAAHARLAGQEADVQKQIQSVRDELARAADRLRAEQDAESVLKRKAEAEHARAGEEEQALIRVRAEETAAATAQSEASRKAREEMTANLARLEQTLANLKAARKREETTYSVVPYNGKQGDSRRPVYVECASGKVIFYPDPTPMAEPFSAAAVQAEVAHRLAAQKELPAPAKAAANTPYLMLLVRPDGVSTYYRFRETLHGGKIDFGYEFIDKDWVLDFPADDRDAPSQTWMAAKPTDAEPAVLAPPAVGIRGVASSHEPAGSPSAAHAGGGSPGLPGLSPPPAVGTTLGAGPGVGPSGGPADKGNSGASSRPSAVGAGSAAGAPDDAHALIPIGAPSDGIGAGPGGPPPTSGTGGPHVAAAGSPPPPLAFGQAPPPGASQGTGTGNAAPPGGATAPDKGGQATTAGKGSPPLPGAAAAPPPTDAAKSPPGAATAGKTAAADNGDDDPFLRAPPAPVLPTKKHAPAPLRPARLSGDRDWIIYVECKPEGVVVYPTQTLVPMAALNRPSGSNPLLQTVQQLIDRKQGTVRAGEMAYRPEVRFLVRPDALRTYHRAYPTLDGLAAPKTAQDLGPDDDVSAVVAGH